jgi:hypothetical protein
MHRCVGRSTWRLRLAVRFEVVRRGHDGGPVVGRDADRNHVLFDELPELDAGVETCGDDVEAAVVGRDVEHDVRVGARKLSELRQEHGGRRSAGQQQPHASGRLVAQAVNLVHRSPNIGESRPQTRDEAFASIGRRDAPRRSRQQAHADPFFQPANRVTQRRGRHTEPLRRPRKASLLCDGEER